jgi:hypothetical protein
MDGRSEKAKHHQHLRRARQAVLYQTLCRPLSKHPQTNNVAFPPSFGGRRVSQRTTPIYAIPIFCGRIACGVPQVPTISGYQQGLRRIAPEGVAALEAAPNDDACAHACGEPPRRQAIVNMDGAIPPRVVDRLRPAVISIDLPRNCIVAGLQFGSE